MIGVNYERKYHMEKSIDSLIFLYFADFPGPVDKIPGSEAFDESGAICDYSKGVPASIFRK